VLKVPWCNILVLNVLAPSEEKSDDSEDIICKELERVFIHFPKHYIKILLGDFNPLKPELKSHLLFAGIIRSSPFSPR